jgi:PAS domain S-box-containing protein
MSVWKEQRSLKWPIMLAATALACLVVSVGSLLAGHWRDLANEALETTVARHALLTARNAAEADARSVAQAIDAAADDASDADALRGLLATSDPLLRGRAILLDAQGAVLGAAEDALGALSVYEDSPVPAEKAAEVVGSLLRSQERDDGRRSTFEGPPLVAMAPVGDSGRRVAVVTPTRVIRNVAAPDLKTQDVIDAQAASWIGVSVFVGVMIVLFGIALAGALRRRLSYLVDGAEQQAGGDYGHRIPVQGSDEFAALALSMNTTAMHFQQMLRQLQESERRLQRIIDEMGDGFVMLDGHDKITFCNRRFTDLLGRAQEQLVGQHIDQLLDSDDGDRFRGDAPDRRQGRSNEYEFSWKTRGPAPQTLVSCSPVYDKEQRWSGSYAVITDITARARAEQEMAQAEKLRALGELAGGVAHDFNNVLTVILGNAQFLIMEEEGQPEHVRKALHVMERAALDGSEMVRRIREFTKTRAVDMHPDLLDPDELVETLAEMARPRIAQAAEAGAQIQVAQQKSAKRLIPGNASELREALLNVVFNAVDAMPQGGTLRIEAFDRGEDSVGVRISDTGEGMDAQTRNKIFDPFFSTKKLGGPASGLGLSITFGIVRSHGGRIDVRSSPGQGTTFTIVLPGREPTQEIVSEAEEPEDTFVPPEPRLLLLGPEGRTLDRRHAWLSESGMFAAAMSSVASALAIVGDKSLFNVVAVQYDLPGSDGGWSVAREIRKARPDVVIILIARHEEQVDETQAQNAGIDHVLREPFKTQDLSDLVHRAVASPRPRAGAPPPPSTDEAEDEGELLTTMSGEVETSPGDPDQESLEAFNQRVAEPAQPTEGDEPAEAGPIVIF